MFRRFKLGLQAHDSVRLSRVKALPVDPLLTQVPRDWAQGRTWDGNVLDNDVLSNCGPAAVINWLKMMAVACGRDDLVFTNQDCLDLYTAMGYDGTPATDSGVVLLDLMNYMQNVGIKGLRFDCFFRVGFADATHLATATYLAPLIVGASLPVACQNADTWGELVASDARVWGGHAYLYHANSPGGGNGKSWGAPVFTTPEFQVRRWNECYLPVCLELNPSGVDVARLLTLAGEL